MKAFFAAIALVMGGILLLAAYDVMGHPPLTEIFSRRAVISTSGHSFDARLVTLPIAGVGLLFLACGVYLLSAKEDDHK